MDYSVLFLNNYSGSLKQGLENWKVYFSSTDLAEVKTPGRKSPVAGISLAEIFLLWISRHVIMTEDSPHGSSVLTGIIAREDKWCLNLTGICGCKIVYIDYIFKGQKNSCGEMYQNCDRDLHSWQQAKKIRTQCLKSWSVRFFLAQKLNSS